MRRERERETQKLYLVVEFCAGILSRERRPFRYPVSREKYFFYAKRERKTFAVVIFYTSAPLYNLFIEFTAS